MAPLTPSPKIKLSRLRDIGWSSWDPIGLLSAGKRWDEDDNRSFADEYDNYLIEAAARLRRGASDADVVNFLMSIEADHMGLGEQPDARARAQSVVAAIRADEELWTYPDK
ncbi:UNVERIFIED_ORG: hypothetical protein J2W85_002409 [Ensifer adhaerens]|nr:hypothetical protein [Ensifer adhaerens]